jgi:hypothetical protein
MWTKGDDGGASPVLSLCEEEMLMEDGGGGGVALNFLRVLADFCGLVFLFTGLSNVDNTNPQKYCSFAASATKAVFAGLQPEFYLILLFMETCFYSPMQEILGGTETCCTCV